MASATGDPLEWTPSHPLAVATRLHLGYASRPPPSSQLTETLHSFANLAATVGAQHAVVAVDSEPKLEGYDLVQEVRDICKRLHAGDDSQSDSKTATEMEVTKYVPIEVLPVTPWGKFVPALNSIVAWSAYRGATYLLLASAEVKMTKRAIDILKHHIDLENTLVAGAALQGHLHQSDNGKEKEVELTGRTTPWNTLALWNLPKLALTGFLLVSEGLHPEEDGREGASGVEEACAIANLQRILPKNMAQAKLVSMEEGAIHWGQDFGEDEQRKEWHEKKMMSKVIRAKRQLDLMGLSGTVLHC